MEDIKAKYLWIVPGYSLTLTALYLAAYWGSFGINIFEYASIHELFSASIYALLGLFFSTILGLAIGFAAAMVSPPRPSEPLVPINSIRTFIRRLFALWKLVILALAVTFASVTKQPWVLIFFVPMFLFDIFSDNEFMKQIFIDPARRLTFIILLFSPFSAVGFAKISAQEILLGRKFYYSDSTGEHIRLIGHAGNWHFFFNVENGSLTLLPDSDEPLRLMFHEAPWYAKN